MSSEEIFQIATIYPTPTQEKVDRVKDLIKDIVASVKANEPGTIIYNSFTHLSDSGEPSIVVIEKYENQAAREAHSKNPKLGEFGSIVKAEGLFAKPMELKPLKALA